MADVLRIAKYGPDWTQYDLRAYNIIVDAVPAVEFFGSEPDADLRELDPSILNHTVGGSMDHVSNASFFLVQKMDWASQVGREKVAHYSAVDNFTSTLLRTLGFQSHLTAVISRPSMPFDIAGFRMTAHADLFLSHAHTDATLLLVRYADTGEPHADPEPGLVAAAIAAFQENTRMRALLDRPAMDEMVFPCVIMAGTRPTFYKIPVSAALNAAVEAGAYPEAMTRVTKCVVPSSRPHEGMENKVFRAAALRYFIALWSVLASLWNPYC